MTTESSFTGGTYLNFVEKGSAFAKRVVLAHSSETGGDNWNFVVDDKRVTHPVR